MTKVIDQVSGDGWHVWNGDAVDVTRALPERSVGLSVYSPPFANLYTYSASERDMGNCVDDAEFLEHYGFVVGELYRATRPGRLTCVHCKDLVDYRGRDGRAGLRDFPGEIIRLHESKGWKYHSRVTIWKDPVIEMQRTKAHGLLYKQLRGDSSYSRQGLAEYVLTFRRWAEEGEEIEPVTHTEESFPLTQWQRWASPVWMDIDQTRVLNVQIARVDEDEKHMCPLQLDVIERCVGLWSNPGDIVFSPFTGIGSEGVVAREMGRRFIGSELKTEYFLRAVRNLGAAARQKTLFEGLSL